MTENLKRLFGDYTRACVRYGATDAGSAAEAEASFDMSRLGKQLWAELETLALLIEAADFAKFNINPERDACDQAIWDRLHGALRSRS